MSKRDGATDPMTCRAFKELAGAYALGALDEGERLACARHLAGEGLHAGCGEALADARWVTAELAVSLPARPLPPRTWTAIEARLGSGSSLPADPNAPTSTPTARARRLWDLADWLVLAMVLGLSLANAPADARRRPPGFERERPARRTAPATMP